MDEKDTSRLEAFSDGVFAVAITLLILNVTYNAIDSNGALSNDGELLREFRDKTPQLISFIASFLTIGIMWLNHHRLFKQIRHADTPLIIINMFLLMTIVFIPVPTSLIAQYLTAPQYHVAAVLFGGIYLLMAMLFNFLWRYASHNGRLLGKHYNEEIVRGISQQYLFGPTLYLLVFLVSFFSTMACVLLCIGLALFFAIPGELLKRKLVM